MVVLAAKTGHICCLGSASFGRTGGIRLGKPCTGHDSNWTLYYYVTAAPELQAHGNHCEASKQQPTISQMNTAQLEAALCFRCVCCLLPFPCCCCCRCCRGCARLSPDPANKSSNGPAVVYQAAADSSSRSSSSSTSTAKNV